MDVLELFSNVQNPKRNLFFSVSIQSVTVKLVDGRKTEKRTPDLKKNKKQKVIANVYLYKLFRDNQ